MGKVKTTNARWESDDQQCQVVVHYMDWTDNGRRRYEWHVLKMNGPEAASRATKTYKRLATGNDLCSGVGDEPDAMGMLGAFSGFVLAWIEACNYGHEDSENRDLFPQTMFDIMNEYGDELWSDVNEQDMMRDQIDELERKIKSIQVDKMLEGE